MRIAIIIALWPILAQAGELDQVLLHGAQAGDAAAVNQSLAQGASIEARDGEGWTPLIIAAKTDHLEVVKSLVERGADVNARSSNKTGSTVLCFAADTDDPALLNFLIVHGAKVNARSRNGHTPLASAVQENHLRAVKCLLSNGADINDLTGRSEDGISLTPLMVAAANNNVVLMALLIEQGAPLEKRNNMGYTALMNTAAFPCPNAFKLLIDKGANVNASGPFGRTALLNAAMCGQMANVKMLLAAGADPNAAGSFCDDPDVRQSDGVALARQNGYREVAAVILEAQRNTRQAPER